MAMSGGITPWRVLQAWLYALLACGGFLGVVHFFTPVVLRHDRDTSVWYLSHLAEENLHQFEFLPEDTDTEKKKQLLDEAVGYLKQARQLRPDSNYYLWLEGIILRNRARLENPPDPAREAESLCLIQQLWERPEGKSGKSARFLADYYLAQGKVDQASPFVEFLLGLNPGDPLAYDGLVQASIKSGDIQGAIQAFERKAKAGHLTPDDHHLLAVLAIQSGDYSKSLDSLRIALERGGETTERWFLYGLAFMGQGDLDSARRAFGVYKYALGEKAELPSAPSLGLPEIPADIFPSLPQIYQSARPSREGFR